jgi:hypothetical protein
MKMIADYIEGFRKGNSGIMRRKAMSFFGMWFAAVLSFKNCTVNNVEQIITVWLCFSAIAIGMVTFEQITQLKHGKDKEINKDS